MKQPESRQEKLKRLSYEWAEKTKPVLSRILFENPSALAKMSYSVQSSLPLAGGSFYNPNSFQRKIRKEGSKYFIDTFVHDDTLYKKDEQRYGLKKVSEIVSSELLKQVGETYPRIKTNRTFGDVGISGKRFIIRKIKRETGIDLRKEVRTQESGLEGTLGIISIAGFLFSLLFFSGVTGNVIGATETNNILGLIFILIGFTFGGIYLYLKKKH